MAQVIEIHDFSDPALDVYARATENQLVNRADPANALFIAESPLVIGRALDAGCVPVSFLMEPQHITGKGAEILGRCDPDLPVYTASLEVLTQLTGFHLTRGMLCAMRRPPLPSVAEVCAGARRIAVLENVMNPTNVGAIFRCAAALGMDAVLLTTEGSDPLYRRASRVSMGNVFLVPWTYLPEGDWTAALHDLGFTTAAMALREDSLRLAVNRAAAQASGYTLKPITLENSYTRNTDGTQTVVMPVTGYVRNADGSGKAITLSAPADKNSAPVALFTFEYAKADTKPDVTYGDVNGDGIINSTDAAIVYRSVNGRYTLTDSQKLSADVNGDGAVNSTDAALIYRYTNGKMSKFPAES